jgi:hypothetical protein
MLRWRCERDGCGESKRGARGSATGCEGGLKRLNRRPTEGSEDEGQGGNGEEKGQRIV